MPNDTRRMRQGIAWMLFGLMLLVGLPACQSQPGEDDEDSDRTSREDREGSALERKRRRDRKARRRDRADDRNDRTLGDDPDGDDASDRRGDRFEEDEFYDRSESSGRRRSGTAAPEGPAASSRLSSADKAAFREAWAEFVEDSPTWPSRRREWLARGALAQRVLAENLYRFFWATSTRGESHEVDRIAKEVRHVGAASVRYFARPLQMDRIQLVKPLRVKVGGGEGEGPQRFEDVDHFNMDDTTRRDAAYVLAHAGDPAVPILAARDVLRGGRPATRRYAAKALGKIGSDEAIAALIGVLKAHAPWQDRSAAVTGLGFALEVNSAARAPLEAAARDPDRFVRKKAKAALAGKLSDRF